MVGEIENKFMSDSFYYVQIIPSKRCNQSCYYCDLSNDLKNIDEEIQIDMDYFKWCIDTMGRHTNNLMIEISGGEPGLLSNLEEALIFLKNHSSVKKTQLMSNGLVRLKRPNLIHLVDSYFEHLVESIKDKQIHKFYDLEFMDFKHTRNVIVLDKNTTDALLKYKDFYSDFYDEDKFWLKLFVERTFSNTFKEKTTKLFKNINSEYAKFNIDRLNNKNTFGKDVCSKIPWLPCIDIEDEKIIHCAYHDFTDRITKKLNAENLIKLIDGKLFVSDGQPSYCKECYHFYDDPLFLMRVNKSNRKQ